MRRALLAVDLVLAGARQLALIPALLGLALVAVIFISYLDRPVDLRSAIDVYPLFETTFPLIGIFLAAGIGSRDAEDRTAETVLTLRLGFPRLILARSAAAATVCAAGIGLGTAASHLFFLPASTWPLFLAAAAPTCLLGGTALLAGTVARSTPVGVAAALAWWAGEMTLKGVTGRCYVLFPSACSGLGPAFVNGRLYLILISAAFPVLAALWATDPERVYRSRS